MKNKNNYKDIEEFFNMFCASAMGFILGSIAYSTTIYNKFILYIITIAAAILVISLFSLITHEVSKRNNKKQEKENNNIIAAKDIFLSGIFKHLLEEGKIGVAHSDIFGKYKIYIVDGTNEYAIIECPTIKEDITSEEMDKMIREYSYKIDSLGNF